MTDNIPTHRSKPTDIESQSVTLTEGTSSVVAGASVFSGSQPPVQDNVSTSQSHSDLTEITLPHATFQSVLSQPAVRALWLASLISYIGDTFGVMALFILVNHITHSMVALATVGVLQTLPLLFAIVAGVLVDRWRYRPVLLVSDLVRAVLLPLFLLFRTSDDLWIVAAVALSVSVASRFFFPASQALRRALLHPNDYTVAAALWQATLGMSYVVGPALAGLVITAFGSNIEAGIGVAFMIDSISFLTSAVIIFVLVREKAQAVDAARQDQEHAQTWADLRAGWTIMWRSRPIRGVVTLYGVGLLGVGAVFVLTVPYVQRAFGGGPLEIGLLEASQALGLAIGATAVGTVLARKLPSGMLMLWASVIGGVSVIGLGMAPIYILALVVMLMMGLTVGVVESTGAAVTLHEIPQRHQGKGNATLNTLINGSYLISIACSGFAGELLGIRGTFIAGGVIALVGVALAVPLLNPQSAAAHISGDVTKEPTEASTTARVTE